ncbi:hypothetical protein PX52LOC_02634 [Limnoglobus roseus]|uniref:Uncharacterized protein n=1 Tax=Limnoglobus roseus TaxID=2598579 RepID=A0A5C1A8P0_9BACT|nr:hypothetical protein PX52LOC_02634 [Limnoglobus roseus]
MGMRKKWSRLITVDGVHYRYHVAEDRFDGRSLYVCVQQVEPAGQRLWCAFQKPTNWTEVAPGHYTGRTEPHAVTPAIIRKLILAGLSQGWQPAELRKSTLHLPDKSVVERLPNPF